MRLSIFCSTLPSISSNFSTKDLIFNESHFSQILNFPGNSSKEKRAVQLIFYEGSASKIKMITKRSKVVSENTEDSRFQAVTFWDLLVDKCIQVFLGGDTVDPDET